MYSLCVNFLKLAEVATTTKGSIVNKIDKELNELVKNIFEQARATYGTRRLKEVLKQRYGLIVSRRKLQRTLKYLNLYNTPRKLNNFL